MAKRRPRRSNLVGRSRRSRKSDKVTVPQAIAGIALVSSIPWLAGYRTVTLAALYVEVAVAAVYVLVFRILPKVQRGREQRLEASRLAEQRLNYARLAEQRVEAAHLAQQQLYAARLEAQQVELARLAEQRRTLYEVGSSGTTGRELLHLTSTQFEEHVAEHYRQQGYTVTLTPVTGDQGLDVIADRDGERIGIQCKLYSGKVGNSAVQEALGGKYVHKCSRVVVIASSGFTAHAIEAARSASVQLIDGEQYQADLRRVKAEQGIILDSP